MDPVEQLRRARSEFQRRVAQVQANHLALPTPCSEWTVQSLLAHVIGADHAYVALLHGSNAEQFRALLAAFEVGDDPLKQFRRSAAEVIAAFGELGALERTVQHPMGEVPAVQLLGMRVAEWTIHGWDLARAIDADDSLDVKLVESLYARLAPRIDALANTGNFQPPTGLPRHRTSPRQIARPTRPTALIWGALPRLSTSADLDTQRSQGPTLATKH
ncbi:MAG: TIGR03086 family metal-binding protein [Actinomycetota bacterium]|nr:TIGR03086 family metal-binding protein [Actinomycetota bacterium]